MKKTTLIGLLALLVPAVVMAQGDMGSRWRDADESVMAQIKYSGSGSATCVVLAASIELRYDGYSQSMSVGASTNIAAIAAWVNSQTNTSRGHLWRFQPQCALSTDTPDSDWLPKTNAMVNGKWNDSTFIWDTTACDHYDVSCSWPMGDFGQGGGRLITALTGWPQGTGNVTVAVYSDSDLQWKTVLTSPYYSLGALTNNTRVDAITLTGDNANIGSGIYIPRGTVGWYRATRATSAESGGIGITWKETN